jgi:glycerol-3-phosphate dehydrogenase
VIWSYACVRPLYDDGKGRADEATRDQILTPDTTGMEAPLLSAFGGKIMTDRRLTEASLAKLAPHFYRLRRLWIAGDDFSGRQP